MADQKKKKKPYTRYQDTMTPQAYDILPNAAANQASWDKAAGAYKQAGIGAAVGSYLHDLPGNLYNTVKDAGDKYLGLEGMGNVMIDAATTAVTGEIPQKQEITGTAQAATSEPLMAAPHSKASPTTSQKATYGALDLTKGDQITRRRVSAASGNPMERDYKYETAGGSLTVHGGPKVNTSGRGTGLPNASAGRAGGRSARRPGGRRMKAGEVLMAPQEQPGGGINDLGLISREKAKEMGIGVNQWRDLNTQILRNMGNINEQMSANQGAANVANIRSESDLAELFAQQDSPQAKAEIATMLEDLKLAPLRTRLMEQQSNILKRDLAGGSKKKKRSESRDITDEIVNERTNLGFMRP